MAHGSVPLAGTPQKLDLAEGAPHWVQNLGDGPMYVQAVTGNTAPTDLDAARFVIPPKGSLLLTAHAGESTFAWGHHGGLVGHSQTPGAGAVVPSAYATYSAVSGAATTGTGRTSVPVFHNFTPDGVGLLLIELYSQSTPPQYSIAFQRVASTPDASRAVPNDHWLRVTAGDATVFSLQWGNSGQRIFNWDRGNRLLRRRIATKGWDAGDTVSVEFWPSEPPAA